VFADPGLGKTAMVLQLIDDLYWEGPLKVLIIAPLRVIYSVWPAEIKKWGWDIHLTHSVLHGKGKAVRARDDSVIHLLNAENIFWHLDDLDQYNVLVVDESSKFKSPSSKRFKALRKHLDSFERRIILTGTPSPNSLMDLYSQTYIVDKGVSLGKNITAYRNRFFYPSHFRNFVEWQPKSGADKMIQCAIAPLVQRIDAETNLDLPELINHTIKIDLPAELQQTYDGLEKQLFAEIENEQFVLASSASAYNACRQFANGRMYKPPEPLSLAPKGPDRDVIQLHDLKSQALKELVGELQGKPLLVAYHYKHDLAQLREVWRKAPVIGGGTTAKEGAAIVRRWNAGEIPILLGHPQSMSHGLNLQQGGRDVAWFSLTDNLENYLQFVRRIYRQGAPGVTRVHHLIVRKTVDEAIQKRLESKDRSQRALLNALARYGEGKC
jgi:SNF2 family DNA or RNA helicase